MFSNVSFLYRKQFVKHLIVVLNYSFSAHGSSCYAYGVVVTLKGSSSTDHNYVR